MDAIIQAAGDIVGFAVTSVGQFAGLFTQMSGTGENAVLANPILLLPIGLLVAGVGVGFLGRLFHLR